ncbi:unnamed protein product [Mytilus coruscus]|uniref:Uncharacterized protein n=1 Tax=Mytilus coruscus TaxID=42192 RepID=A0A6J8EE91_MYTCO|nr:unnamed protein product [Mytilus coruscus]
MDGLPRQFISEDDIMILQFLKTLEDDIMLSQVLEKLEDDMEPSIITLEAFFGEFTFNIDDENAFGDLTSTVSQRLTLDWPDFWFHIYILSGNGEVQSIQIWKSDLDQKREKKKQGHERNTEFADANETLEEHRANIYAHWEGDVNREYGMAGHRGQRGMNTDGFQYNNPHTVSIRPEPYDGGEDWEEYISHFEVKCRTWEMAGCRQSFSASGSVKRCSNDILH